MNTNTDKAPLGVRNADGSIIVSRALLVALYIIAATIYIPTVLFTTVIDPSSYIYMLSALALPALGIALCTKLISSVRPMIVFIIISAIIMFMGADLGLSAILPVFFLLTALCAYLIRNQLTFLLIPTTLVSVGIILLLSQNVFLAASSIVFLPLAFALFFSFKKKKQRVATICTMTLAFALPLLLLFALWLLVKDGALSLSSLRAFFDSFREGLTSELSGILIESATQIGAEINSAELTEMMSYMLSTIFNFLPAIFAVILFVFCYIVHSLYISLITPITEDKGEIINALTFKMSVTSAVIFLLAFVAALILDYEGLSVYATAAQNIYVMLFPGLSLITFSFVGALTKRPNASCLGVIVYIAMFALLLFATDVVLVVSAFAGAVIVIAMAAKRKAEEMNSDNDNKN